MNDKALQKDSGPRRGGNENITEIIKQLRDERDMCFLIKRAHQMPQINFYRDPYLDTLYWNFSSSVLKKDPKSFQKRKTGWLQRT